MSITAYVEEHDEQRLPPLNDTYLSGRPYYCDLCGAGYAEYIACEMPDCMLESVDAARARLVKAHREGKGMPQP
jgi:hypothetical protein